jgi:hypothetical protein
MTRSRELAELATAYDTGTPLGFRNRIINGDMRIDQRNAGAAVTITATGASQYYVDRWYLRAESATGSKVSVQRSTVAPVGFTNSALITSLSAYTLGASEHFGTTQAIEGFNVADLGWGTANAQSITFSFWVRSSLTGTFGGAFANSAVNRSFVFSYTINAANTWEYKTITVPGDTSGTWLTDNGIGMYLSFVVAAGSSTTTTAAGSWSSTFNRSVTGQVSLVGTSGATFYITGVQLEAGSVATPFERRPYATEEQLCLRYLPAINAVGATSQFFNAYVQSANTFNAVVPFKVRTRVAPTGLTSVGTASNFAVAFGGGGQGCTTAPTFSDAGTESARILFTVSSASLGAPGIAYMASSGLQLLFTGCEL